MTARRFAALLLALALLSGCSWMDGSYVSVTPHQVGPNQTASQNTRTIKTYTELRSALVELIDAGSDKGLFSLADYPREDIAWDMERAVNYVTNSYPIGAYAVESIDYDLGTGLGAIALSVDISYRHSREKIESIRTVRWTSGAERAIADALNESAQVLILQITGYQDTDFVEIVQEYARSNPDRVMEIPSVDVQVFPNWGDTRVLELTFSYQTDRDRLRTMREQVQPVFSSAALYVSGQADDYTKFSQLHTFLMERFDYTIEPTATPAYSLLCQGIGDSRAFSLVYAAMCHRIELEALCVSGTRNGEAHWWNLIRIDGTWYHLDLLASRQFQPMTDGDMTAYDWDETGYPQTAAAQ